MNKKTNKNKNKQSQIKDTYRLVVIDEDTLKEVRSLRFSISRVLFLVFGSILLIAGLTFLLVSYTPLRYTVPGYAKIENNRVYMDLIKRLEEVETELDAQRVYTTGIQNMLNPSGQGIDEGGQLDDFGNHRKADVNLSEIYMTPPIKGKISAHFNLKTNHLGIDIIAPKETPVKSILAGVVVNADWSLKTGNTISIQHPNDLLSVYKHNSAILKKIGETVEAGEAIAIIGNTGELTTGPHVHFELWSKGVAVNPSDYINFE